MLSRGKCFQDISLRIKFVCTVVSLCVCFSHGLGLRLRTNEQNADANSAEPLTCRSFTGITPQTCRSHVASEGPPVASEGPPACEGLPACADRLDCLWLIKKGKWMEVFVQLLHRDSSGDHHISRWGEVGRLAVLLSMSVFSWNMLLPAHQQ